MARTLPVILLVLLATGCSQTLPPPAVPPASIPETTIPEPGPTSGMARVMFTTDVPARIERRTRLATGRHHPIIRESVCSATPCTITLPYGDHEVWFVAHGDESRTSKETVHVTHATEVVNHAIGEIRSPSLLPILVLGVGATLVGVACGAALFDSEDGLSNTALFLGAAGLAVSTGGILVYALSPGSEQPGATRQWTPPPSAPVVSGSFRLRF